MQVLNTASSAGSAIRLIRIVRMLLIRRIVIWFVAGMGCSFVGGPIGLICIGLGRDFVLWVFWGGEGIG